MKRLGIPFLFFFGLILTVNSQQQMTEPAIGDVLVINAPNGSTYNHVFLPKLNFMVKRGKIASYKSIFETRVVIKDLETKNGSTYAILQKESGKKFFGYLSKVRANYTKALSSGELSIAKDGQGKPSSSEAIALSAL